MSNQMSSQRQLRFSELIRSLISECLLFEDFYDLSFEISSITVSFVKMSKDLRVANVYLMPLGGKNKNKITRFTGHALGLSFLEGKSYDTSDSVMTNNYLNEYFGFTGNDIIALQSIW